jgi:hypothetical protein
MRNGIREHGLCQFQSEHADIVCDLAKGASSTSSWELEATGQHGTLILVLLAETFLSAIKPLCSCDSQGAVRQSPQKI